MARADGISVLLSTATEEVLVADNAIADRLMGLEGEVVAVEGRLIDTADGPPTMVVRSFRVLGASHSSAARGTWARISQRRSAWETP